MTNRFSLIASNEEGTAFNVSVADSVVGQVALVDGGWHFRMEPGAEWSSFAVGSQSEAAEFVLVERGLLQVNSKGVAVSHIDIRQ